VQLGSAFLGLVGRLTGREWFELPYLVFLPGVTTSHNAVPTT